MTKRRYPEGCAAGFQVRGATSSPVANNSNNAWIVNFNNGNTNNNNNYVRVVRSGECPSGGVAPPSCCSATAFTPSCKAGGLPAGLGGGNVGGLSKGKVAEGVKPPGPLSKGESGAVLRTVHALLRRPPQSAGVVCRSSALERAQVPPHKRLVNAPIGCGLPAGLGGNGGTLSKDQVAEKMSWLLSATPPAPAGLPPVLQGGKTAWGEAVQHTARTPQGRAIHADERQRAAIRSVWASYQGHFRHADSYKLQQDFYRRYDWLAGVTTRPPKQPRPLLPCPGLPAQEFHHV